MFVFNIKFKKNIIKKIAISVMALVIIIVFIIVGFRFINLANKLTVNDDYKTTYLEINSNNYSSILKDSHENIDKYVGKQIKFVGFVYRLYDFDVSQFVLAREMVISSNNEAVVVGFLCDCSNISASNQKDFIDGTWVEVEGSIYKGYYHGDLPVINITKINKADVPIDEYVFPPDGSYINTEI